MQVVDQSITNKMLTPVREWIVTFVPPNVAPSVLSLTALLCVIQAWYICTLYSENFPRASSLGAICLGTVFWVLHSIQSLHARRHRQETPVTELFGYVTDNIATVFLMQVFCMLLKVESLELRWYIVQVGQLVLMRKHINAFVRGGGVQHRMLTGPGEAMCLYLIVIGVRGTLGLEWLGQIYLRAWVALVGCCSRVMGELPIAADDPWQVAHDSVVALYLINVAHTFIEIGLVGSERKGGHKETRFGTHRRSDAVFSRKAKRCTWRGAFASVLQKLLYSSHRAVFVFVRIVALVCAQDSSSACWFVPSLRLRFVTSVTSTRRMASYTMASS